MKTNNAKDVFQDDKVRKQPFASSHGALADFPNISPSKGESRVIGFLNSLLANEFALFTKTLNFHWNVTGPRFHSVHQFLDDQYNELLKMVDDVAERIREIGGNPMGTLTELQSATSLVERPGAQPETSNMIADLMSGHESIQVQIKVILKQIQKGKDDPGTEDFLISLLKKHEEMAWMLKSHIER